MSDSTHDLLTEQGRVWRDSLGPDPRLSDMLAAVRRRRSVLPAMVAAAVLVVAVAVGIAGVAGGHRGPVTGNRRMTSAPPSAGQLDALAKAAPCQLALRDQHPAAAAQLASFTAVAAVECVMGSRTYPGKGEWTVLVRRVATAPLGRLVAALSKPDQDTPRSIVCSDVGYGPLQLLLVNHTGRYLHPRAPTDACGAPQRAVDRAVRVLRWRTVSVTRLTRTRTPTSIASGCEMRWKNELSYDGQFHLPSSAGGLPFGGSSPSRLRVCLYHSGADIAAGDFERSIRFNGDKAHRLLSALAGPGPSGACRAQHNFATIWASGRWINVELGGCWRVQRPGTTSETIGTAVPALVKQLLKTN